MTATRLFFIFYLLHLFNVLLCDHHRRHVHCEYSNWTNVRPCSVSCGGGLRSRSRYLTNLSPDCPLNETAEVKCNERKCPSDCLVTRWSEWKICTSCESGMSKRTRRIIHRRPGSRQASNSTRQSSCAHTSESTSCMVQCKTVCENIPWAEWAPCNSTCGFGETSRIRKANPDWFRKCSMFNETRHCLAVPCNAGDHQPFSKLIHFSAFVTFSLCLILCVLIVIRVAIGEGVCSNEY